MVSQSKEKYNIKDIIGTIIEGDCLEELKKFPDESVDLIINSPPYFGLRSYSNDLREIGKEKTVKEYVKKLTEVYCECKRVLKKTGSFWLNISDSYSSHNWLNRKDKFGIDSINIKRKHGRGASAEVPSMSLIGVPERLMLSLIDNGWILRNKCLWIKSIIDKNGETTGGCMPTSNKRRFNQNAFEYFYFFVKDKKYYFNDNAIRVPYKEFSIDKNPKEFLQQQNSFLDIKKDVKPKTEDEYQYRLKGERTYKNAKSTSQHIWERKTKIPEKIAEGFGSPRARYHRKTDLTAPFFREGERGDNINQENYIPNFSSGKIPGCCWGYNTIPTRGIHTALFPHTLLKRPIESCLPLDGILLDPFCGLATSWLAQQMYQPNASFIGIELNPEYIQESYKRIKENYHPKLL